MESSCFTRFDRIARVARKKRTQISRRPKTDSLTSTDAQDSSSLSATPPSDGAGKVSSGEVSNEKSGNKQLCLNEAESRTFYAGESNMGNTTGQIMSSHRRSSEGVLSPANWRSTHGSKDTDSGNRRLKIYNGNKNDCPEPPMSDNKVKKVKLKLGGITHTIHANSESKSTSPKNKFQSSDISTSKTKQHLKVGTQDGHQKFGLQGVPWKDFATGSFSIVKNDNLMPKVSATDLSMRHVDKSDTFRKKRASKKRSIDDELDDEEKDDEIRYLEKLKRSAKGIVRKADEDEDDSSSKKHRKLSSMEKIGTSRQVKDSKRPRAEASGDMGITEEMESDAEMKKDKKQKMELVVSLMDDRKEATLTTRQRALQSSKDGSTGNNLIEFPNGLPAAPSKKQKEKPNEVEQQLKKAEAAQRRRIQVEKAAKESAAEAIRKVLGQDSNRKKRAEKIKKKQEEMAQEKAANALLHASNTIKWTMGPTGTVVTFPDATGLPSLFESKPCSYPPPREKCARPSCDNPYKYRDSKSKLPLCSLECYKAVQDQTQAVSSC